MRQTLFTIPYEIGGEPLFGFGVLLGLWAILGIVVVVRAAKRQGWNADTLSYLPFLAIVGAALLFLPKMFPYGLPIRGYGVMVVLGAVSGVGLAVYRARRAGISPDTILSLAFGLFICGIVGARLFYVIEYWDAPDGPIRRDTLFETLKSVVNIPQGGLVVYGSLIGASLAFVVFTRRRKLPMLALADLIAPSLLIGLAFGRIGCLMNGCCYGGVCDKPWAVTFPAGSPPYMQQLKDDQLKSGLAFDLNEEGKVVLSRVEAGSSAEAAGLHKELEIVAIGEIAIHTVGDAYRALGEEISRAQYEAKDWTLTPSSGTPIAIASDATPLPPRSRPVHPTQIYSAVNALLLFFFLWQFYPLRRRDGEVIALLLTIYPITRFLLEIIRTDESAIFGTGLSISQNVSILLFVGVVCLWVYVERRPRGSALPLATA